MGLERAVLLSPERLIDEGDLPLELSVELGRTSTPHADGTLAAAQQAFERGSLRKVLALHGGRRRECAEVLGIGYSTLKAKLRHHGISGQAEGVEPEEGGGATS